MEKRKGSRSIQEIPPGLLKQLNTGQLETANLVEWLAIDQALLLQNVLNELERPDYATPILAQLAQLKKSTVNTRNETIGTGLLAQATAHEDAGLLPALSRHPSDSVRCWLCYAIGRNPGLSLPDMLEHIRPLAADSHFGVREVSWMATRPAIAQNLPLAISLLQPWVHNPNENIRRFASEATRPRGVWCAHIEALKRDPDLALPLLLPLHSDPSRYVQNSVANWLNDASKTRPDFVRQLCQQWLTQNPSPATQYIVKRGLRSVG